MSQATRRPRGLHARILIALLALVFAATGAVVFAPAAYAGTNDYPTKWKDKPRDSMFDDWGEYNRECTSFAAWRLHSHNGFEMPFHANANRWGAKAQALGYTVNHSPSVGSIAYWDTSTRSHVAWVEQVNPDNTVEIEQYNIGETGKYSEATIASSDPSGYIHFKDLVTSLADGSLINYDKQVYVMAGGAPLYVTTWADYGKKPSGLIGSKKWASLAKYPADGTFLTAKPSGNIYEVVGGAPVSISSWTEVGGVKPSVTVTDADISGAGATTGVLSHLAYHPKVATYVTAVPSTKVYQLLGGAAQLVTDTSTLPNGTPTLTIGDDDIAGAGAAMTTPFSHLRGTITTAVPTIARAGVNKHHLQATATGWAPSGLVLSYQWYRNGKLISGATTSSYRPKASDTGSSFTVKVTATRTNYVTASVTSAAHVITG